MVTFKVGESLAGFDFSIKNAKTGLPVSLVGMSVNLKFRINKGPLKERLSINVIDAPNGRCRYLLQSGDLDIDGTLRGEVELVSGVLLGLPMTFTALVEPRV